MPGLSLLAIGRYEQTLNRDVLLTHGLGIDGYCQPKTVHRPNLGQEDLLLEFAAREFPRMDRHFTALREEIEGHRPVNTHGKLIPRIEDMNARDECIGDRVAVVIGGRPDVEKKHICLGVTGLRTDVRFAARLGAVDDAACADCRQRQADESGSESVGIVCGSCS